jgi:hypothetical protein
MVLIKVSNGTYKNIVQGFHVSVNKHKDNNTTMWTYSIDGVKEDRVFFTKKLCVKRLREELNFIINNN